MHLLSPVIMPFNFVNFPNVIVLNLDKIVCYHGTWANYRPGNCRFTVENIDPFLCTHVVYGFVGVKADGSIRLIDSRFDIYFGKYVLRFFTNKRLNNIISLQVA